MMNDELFGHLAFLYGSERAPSLLNQLEKTISDFQHRFPDLAAYTGPRVTEQDAILITYGDMVRGEGSPLRVLGSFLEKYLAGLVNGVHFLPFFPYSSDDGFSVIDYWRVDPDLGNWDDVAITGRHFRLMFDAVINHISAESEWFQRFLQGDPTYQDYFVTAEPTPALSQVFRPRTHPLLTEVDTPFGSKYVWTTFSPDQVDLNFSNPEVLLKIIELLLFYIEHGAEFIRLDAIGFMWKEVGTTCIHLPQTHRAIQLMRSVLNIVSPHVSLITETNVPHLDNISYFGDGANEAQMVYNFSLPPLTLHAFHTGDATILSRWAATLDLPSDKVTFFNFLASHDGIGLTPVKALLDDSAVSAIVNRVQDLGGFVSYKTNPDGSRSAYELNINYLDALGDPDNPDEPLERVSRRFLTSQAIMLALRGVPGIYFQSLFGLRGWPEGVKQSGRNRTINRRKYNLEELEQKLTEETSLSHRVFDGYARLIELRTAHPAFHPNGGQKILSLHPALFSLERRSPDGSESVICLHNVSDQAFPITLLDGLFEDLLTNQKFSDEVVIRPYDCLWLQSTPK